MNRFERRETEFRESEKITNDQLLNSFDNRKKN